MRGIPWIAVVLSVIITLKPPQIIEPKNAEVRYLKLSDPPNNILNHNLTCQATGTPKPTYKWTYNGGNVPGAVTVDPVTGTLVLNDFSRREEGKYQCYATNELTPGNFATAIAPVIDVLAIMLGPFPADPDPIPTKIIKRGDPVSLTCDNQPSCRPPCQYKWFLEKRDPAQKSEEITTNNRVYIDALGSLHYANVETTDTKGDYKLHQCGLYNSDLATINLGSKKILEITNSPSIIETDPAILFYTQGEEAKVQRLTNGRLECVFSGYQTPRITWFDTSRNPISNNNKYTVSTNGHMLTIKNVDEVDEGSYTCRGTNPRNIGTEQPVYMNVTSIPIDVQQLRDETVAEGKDATMTCISRSLQGESPPSVPVWLKNGDIFTPDNNKYILSGDGTKLTIKNLKKPDDISCFQCNVSNSEGYAFHSGCLNVILPITVTKQPPLDQKIRHGDIVNLTVKATTDPSEEQYLQYRWIFANKTYQNGIYPPHVQLVHGELLINTSALSEKEYATIRGDYTCNIVNRYDSRNVVIKVDLEDVVVPGPVATGGGDYWWIAMVVAILILIVIIVLICVICRRKNQEGVYPVDKKERAADLDPEKDLADSGFHDLSRADDDFVPNRPPPGNMLDDYVDSDDEGSLVQYGDLDTGKFNEDGSFIGIYGNKDKPAKPSAPTESTI